MRYAHTDIFKRLLHWLLRFRKRCGYGIHSPFAFNFVTQVIYEKGEYYAYSRLERLGAGVRTDWRLKDYRLLFRVMNFQRPAVCLCVGTADDTHNRNEAESALSHTDLLREYMHAGSSHTRLEMNPSACHAPFDMIWGEGEWMSGIMALLPRLSLGGMVMVHDICSTRERRDAWKRLKTADQSTLTFDLRDFGIVMYRPELQRQDYVVNYF